MPQMNADELRSNLRYPRSSAAYQARLSVLVVLRRRLRGGFSMRPSSVASAASTRNRSAFEVVCKVKSKKLCTSTAKHPLNDASATPRLKSSRDLAREIAL